MMVPRALLAVAVAACGGAPLLKEPSPVGNTTPEGSGSRTVQIVLGDALDISGTNVDESVAVVAPDSSPLETYGAVEKVDLRCQGEMGARCHVEGQRVVPKTAGTFDVTASDKRSSVTWSVVVVEVDGLEIAPCGSLTVDATSDHDGGVAMVTPTLVVRTKAGTRVPASGATINDRPIDDPSFYSLRATTSPSTHTVRGRYREHTTSCRVTLVARPMKS